MLSASTDGAGRLKHGSPPTLRDFKEGGRERKEAMYVDRGRLWRIVGEGGSLWTPK